MPLRPMLVSVDENGAILWIGEVEDWKMTATMTRIKESRLLPTLWELKAFGLGGDEGGPFGSDASIPGRIRFSYVFDATVRFLVQVGWSPELEEVFHQLEQKPGFPVSAKRLRRLRARFSSLLMV